MTTKKETDDLYIDISRRIAQESKAVRKKVGGVLIKNQNIISYGWNGTPSGDDNTCEDVDELCNLITKKEVTHCEMNIFGKLLDSDHPQSTKGSELFLTLSPCFECAKLIKRAGTVRVVYDEEYRNPEGIYFLRERGVIVEKYEA